jgi:formyltetrahydrofolate-dependent phosphoribosylglycinamide formyltransferase
MSGSDLETGGAPDALPLAVLLSGTGRTLENLLATIARGALAARVAVVVSSRPGVRGLAVAEAHGIPTRTVERRDFADDATFSAAIYGAVAPHGPRLIVLGGFLRRLTIPPAWAGRIINIHPSLLPAFGGRGLYGRRVHEAVLAHGVKVTGCTVHFADDEYDHGPIVLQRAVPVLDDDTAETLGERVFAAECALYPAAIALFAAGRLRPEGRRVRVLAG